MATGWTVLSDISSVAQLTGVDFLGVGEMVKEGVESAANLQGDADDLEIVVQSGRLVSLDLSKSDNPVVKKCLQKLDKDLKTAQVMIPEARFKTPGFVAGQLRKDMATSKEKVTSALELVNSALICESNVEIKAVKLELQAGLEQILAALQIAPGNQTPSRGSSVLTKLNDLALRDHQRIVLSVESAPFGTAKWKQVGTAYPTPVDSAGGERGSVAGDYELFNNHKIRARMKSHDTLYFHILTADSSDPSPKVHFPKAANKKNELRGERKFPNKMSHVDDDESWVFLNPTRQIQQCSAYFVFTKERLPTGDAKLTTEHIEEVLGSEDVIVEVLTFLVKHSVTSSRNTRIRVRG